MGRRPDENARREIMIIDSSVWINYLTGKSTIETEFLDNSLSAGVAQHICPPVYQEVLQGIWEEIDYKETKEALLYMDFLQLDPYFAADNAASIYRSLRKKGI